MYKDLFERALHIESPWFISELNFNEKEKQLVIFVDFKKGSKFGCNRQKLVAISLIIHQ